VNPCGKGELSAKESGFTGILVWFDGLMEWGMSGMSKCQQFEAPMNDDTSEGYGDFMGTI